MQSLYDYVDMLDAILDPRSILIVKSRLALFFYNAMIDVEVVIPAIAYSARMWKLLHSYVDVFSNVIHELKLIQQFGWEDSGVNRQAIEYMLVCALVTGGFFQCIYDASKIYGEKKNTDCDTVHLTSAEVNELIETLYRKIKTIIHMKSPIFNDSHVQWLENCLEGLNMSAGFSLSCIDSEEAELEMPDKSTPDDTDDILQDNVIHEFSQFCNCLTESRVIATSIELENQEFIHEIEKLPFLHENKESELQFEPLIHKLVDHVHDRLITRGDEKYLDPRCTESTKWVICCFRTLVENKWGMTIYDRDDNGGEAEDMASCAVVSALNDCGVTTLCLDLISIGIDNDLLLECVKLCVALLFKEGGHLRVQMTIHKHLETTSSDTFFLQIRSCVQKLISWHEWIDSVGLENDEDRCLPDETIVIRFLQLLCEGHFNPCQDLLRDQPSNCVSINLLDDFIMYLSSLSQIPCKTSTIAAIQLTATILEVIQGPCERNQDHFILQSELMETLNRLLRAHPVNGCTYEDELALKKTCVEIYQGLLEGRGGTSAIYERVLSVIHLDIIQMLSTTPAPGVGDSCDQLSLLRTESLVLLQMLCDFKTSLKSELSIDFGSTTVEVTCVEILWRGELQRRFFNVPEICLDLAKASKDALIESVDRSSAENKLQDFLFRSHELYGEIIHQQLLKEWKVSGIFSRANQDLATWISFFLALIINFLLLIYYSADTGRPSLPPQIRIMVDTMNLIQLFFSLFTLILFLVVRVPVKYQKNLDSGHSKLVTILYTATDGLTMYYFLYFIFCLLAINLSDLFLTFLLLDVVVKNSTTRDVLNAVIYPRRQLAMTILLGIFVVYVFSFVIVSLLLNFHFYY